MVNAAEGSGKVRAGDRTTRFRKRGIKMGLESGFQKLGEETGVLRKDNF